MTSRKQTLSSTVAAGVRSLLSPRGREQLSPIPHSPNVSNRRVKSEQERIQAIIRGEKLRAEMEASGNETFEEADDFEVGDDYDPSSPYEEIFDPVAAKQSASKPLPKKPDDQDDEADSGDHPAKPRKNKAVVEDRTYSGTEFAGLVSFIRRAPADVIDKLFSKSKDEEPTR